MLDQVPILLAEDDRNDIALMTGFIQAASEIKQNGTFGFVDNAIITAELNKYFPH